MGLSLRLLKHGTSTDGLDVFSLQYGTRGLAVSPPVALASMAPYLDKMKFPRYIVKGTQVPYFQSSGSYTVPETLVLDYVKTDVFVPPALTLAASLDVFLRAIFCRRLFGYYRPLHTADSPTATHIKQHGTTPDGSPLTMWCPSDVLSPAFFSSGQYEMICAICQGAYVSLPLGHLIADIPVTSEPFDHDNKVYNRTLAELAGLSGWEDYPHPDVTKPSDIPVSFASYVWHSAGPSTYYSGGKWYGDFMGTYIHDRWYLDHYYADTMDFSTPGKWNWMAGHEYQSGWSALWKISDYGPDVKALGGEWDIIRTGPGMDINDRWTFPAFWGQNWIVEGFQALCCSGSDPLYYIPTPPAVRSRRRPTPSADGTDMLKTLLNLPDVNATLPDIGQGLITDYDKHPLETPDGPLSY